MADAERKEAAGIPVGFPDNVNPSPENIAEFNKRAEAAKDDAEDGKQASDAQIGDGEQSANKRGKSGGQTRAVDK